MGNDVSKKSEKQPLLTVPNLLSCLRILLIPLFMLLYLRAETDNQYFVAAMVVALSGLTDLFDGRIARKYNQVTELGKILDPIADKLTQAGILICLMQRYTGIGALTILFIVKEGFMTVASLIFLRRGKKMDGAKWYGKVSTMVFFLCMGCLMAFPWLPLWAVNAMLVATGACLLLSFVLYILLYAKMYRGDADAK